MQQFASTLHNKQACVAPLGRLLLQRHKMFHFRVLRTRYYIICFHLLVSFATKLQQSFVFTKSFGNFATVSKLINGNGVSHNN